MPKVFVLTSGEYSNYSVDSVWTEDHEAACRRYAALYGLAIKEMEANLTFEEQPFEDKYSGKLLYELNILNEEGESFTADWPMHKNKQVESWLARFVQQSNNLADYERRIETGKKQKNFIGNAYTLGDCGDYVFDLYLTTLANYSGDYQQLPMIRLWVIAENEQHALKIGSEFRAQWIAGNLAIYYTTLVHPQKLA